MGSNSSPVNGNQTTCPATLNIKVSLLSHESNQHQVAIPSNSTFGDLKSVITRKIGVNPETHKLLFRGKEKEDDENLQTAGIKDNSKVLLMEDIKPKQKIPEIVNIKANEKIPEKVNETSVISRGCAAVADVKDEVDKLSEQVSALQAVIDSGTRVDDRDIMYVTEMLMRQLLKLDGIEAEGEGKVQRKMEVRRVQSFVDTMDILKSKNSNPFNNVNDSVLVTTQWETFEPTPLPPSNALPPPPSAAPPPPSNAAQPPPSTASDIPPPPPSMPSSTKVTEDWEQFD